LRVWRGREWRILEKGASGNNRGFWEGRILRDSFFFIIQNDPNLENSKIVSEKVFRGFI
jgi:hypothetical protein